jgi:hypothetical protein
VFRPTEAASPGEPHGGTLPFRVAVEACSGIVERPAWLLPWGRLAAAQGPHVPSAEGEGASPRELAESHTQWPLNHAGVDTRGFRATVSCVDADGHAQAILIDLGRRQFVGWDRCDRGFLPTTGSPRLSLTQATDVAKQLAQRHLGDFGDSLTWRVVSPGNTWHGVGVVLEGWGPPAQGVPDGEPAEPRAWVEFNLPSGLVTRYRQWAPTVGDPVVGAG